jgi:hypothetical protein
VLRWLIGTRPVVDRVIEVARILGMMDPYSTLDVAPTVLAYLGLPVAADMDGRIMARSLAGADYQPAVVETYADLLGGGVGESVISEEENERMMDRLRALGYLN